MNRPLFDPTTFAPSGARNHEGDELGTVRLGGGETALAYRIPEGILAGMIVVHGFVGRYHTATKPWPAYVTYHAGRISATFGRDDRAAKFRKERGISYEPETYARLTNSTSWEASQ